MKIKNIDGLTTKQLQDEISKGGRFIRYQYCISMLVITLRRPSAIYFVHHNKKSGIVGLKYSLISFFLGWWGLPWGPIYTIGSLSKNFTGGEDLTHQVNASLMANQSFNSDTENVLPDYTT